MLKGKKSGLLLRAKLLLGVRMPCHVPVGTWYKCPEGWVCGESMEPLAWLIRIPALQEQQRTSPSFAVTLVPQLLWPVLVWNLQDTVQTALEL